MLQVNDPLPANTRITNWAEISDATDKNNNPVVDKDSNPDGTNDDKFLVDDYIDGDGKNGGDEDDHDRADLFILPYDLALIKQLAPGQARNVAAGDTVTFRITVLNQGQINADSILITDYIPGGMTFIPQAGWTGGGSVATTTLTGVLTPGASKYVDINLKVSSPLAANTALTNWAEITQSTDDSGNFQIDIDSDPDAVQGNDNFVTDNDWYGDGKAGEDEDDHDPETVYVNPYDLALYKVLAPGQTAQVNPGDIVDYRIVVVNQGVVDAANIVVTDYIPSQMTYVPSGWTLAGSTATITLPGVLKAGDTIFTTIKLRLNSPQPANTTITNWAEITSSTDKNGNIQVDIDSDPDNIQPNDKFLSDNEINGNGKNGGDEDDHDKADIYVQPFDLALVKRLAPGQSPTVAPGQVVNYQIKVVNQGKVPASNIVITDYIPSDMIFVAQPDWTAVGSVATRAPLTAVVNPGDSVLVFIQLQVNPALAEEVKTITNWAEISAATDQNNNPQVDIDSDPDQVLNNDHFYTDDYIDGNGKNGGDEDDHDLAVINIEKFDLALYKVLAPGQPEIVAPGDTVTFKITIVNQGVIPADNIQITDYIPSGMTYVPSGWATVSGSEVNRTLVAGVDLPATGLLPKDSVSTTIKTRVNAPFVPGTSLVNFAEISASTDTSGFVQIDIDSDPDNNPDNDTYLIDNDIDGNGKAQGDEDDHDPASVKLKEFDLALYKQIIGNQLVAPGDTVSFKITVVNQGTIDAANVKVTDYIPSDMTLLLPQANGWMQVGANAETEPGILAVGQSTSVTIMLQVNDPLPANTRITNWAEISDATDKNGNPVVDKDSNPDGTNDDKFLVDDYIDGDGKNGGDEDDHDRADLFILPYDLALIKQLAPGQPRNVNAGDTVTFRITVLNQGQINADSIVITDYIPGGMTFIPQAGWTGGGSVAMTTLTGVLTPGVSKYVDIKLRVSSPLASNTALTNWAEITQSTDDSGNFQIDIDSDPDAVQGNDKFVTDNDWYGDGKMGEDEDDHDPETVYVNPYDLALYKVLAPGQTAQVNPGDTVSYRIVVVNQGVVDAANIVVTDYIPSQMTYVTQAGWTPVGLTATTTLPGVLKAGDTIFTTIKLRLNSPQPANTTITNWAEITSSTDKNGNIQVDIDSDPDNIQPNDKFLVDNDINGNGKNGGDEDDHDKADIYVQPFDLALVKRLAPTQKLVVAPDQLVNFEIKVVNQGKVPASKIVVTDYIPAELQFVPQPDWTAVGSVATRTALMNVLNPGDSVVVGIQLMVRSGITMAGVITNWAEISAATDQNNNPQVDIDSDPDQIQSNDHFFIDDYIDGNGKNGGDEDDHDKAILLLEPLSLGNLVWYDTNNNGTWEPTEKGVANVEVILFDGTGTVPLDTQYTDANGKYLFEGLMPGDYKVKLNSGIPSGYTSSTGDGKYDYDQTGAYEVAPDPDNNFNHDDNGTQMGSTMIMSGVITLSFGQEPVDDEDVNPNSNLTVDFGIYKLDTFDLALKKVIAANQHFPILSGDDVDFDITVYNQGSVDAYNVEITDYLPVGLSLSPLDANGWNGSSAVLTNNSIPFIAKGGSVVLKLKARVGAGVGKGDLVNYAEVSNGDDDTDASNDYPIDIDSDPDGVQNNDAGGQPNSAADNYVLGDGTGVPGGSTAATDEDDHDPALFSVDIFDLALRKTTSQSTPVKVGDVVPFTITVFNQGTVQASNVVVEDRIPSGFALAPAGNAGWSAPVGNRTSRTIAGPIVPGGSQAITINLLVLPSVTTGDKVNRAEITAAQDSTGVDRTLNDIDSSPDNVDGNDKGGNVDGATNDYVDGNGKANGGAPGDNNIATDEDDEDPAKVTVIFDLALRKVINAGQQYPILAGDDVDFDITVFNQGGSDAYNVVVSDYLPTGLTLSPLDANGWNGNGSVLTSTTIPKIPFGGSVVIKLKGRVAANVGKGSLVNYAEISAADDDTDPSNTPPTDIDSSPDDINTNDDGGQPNSPADNYVLGDGKAAGGAPGDGNQATDEDDHDPALFEVDVFDLALRKTTTATIIKKGDLVPFTITVFNQGTVQAKNVVVEDRIPAGFALDDAAWTSVSADVARRTIAGPIVPGGNSVININLRALPSVKSGDHINYAEIFSAQDSINRDRSQNDIDSQPDDNNTNDDGGAVDTGSDNVITGNGKDPLGTPGDGNAATDEDDHDPAKVTVIFDLALKKVINPAQVFPILPGDDVDFIITVSNQGGADAYNVMVTDYLPQYLSLSPLDINSWSGFSSIITSDTIRKIAVGDSVRIFLKARLANNAPAGDKVNYAEISSADDDTDSSNTYPTDVDSTPDGVNGNDDGGQPNSPNDNFVNGDGKAAGGAPGDTGTATDEDDHDPALFRTDVFDLALRKTTTRTAPVSVGDDVPFKITVFNQGTLTAANIVVEDRIPAGFSLSPLAANSIWTLLDTVRFNTNVAGPLNPGDSTFVTIWLRANSSLIPGKHTNFAEITAAKDDLGNDRSNDDMDSTPDTNNSNDRFIDDVIDQDGKNLNGDEDDHDGATVESIFDLALRKVISPNEEDDRVYPTEDFDFRITVINQGGVVAKNIIVTDSIPTGFELNDPDWTWDNLRKVATIVLPDNLNPLDSVKVDITLKAISVVPGFRVNWSEISRGDDVAGNTPEDLDSKPDGNLGNDDGGLPGSPADNFVDGDGKAPGGAPRDGNTATDEDDMDPALVRLAIFDLAMKKHVYRERRVEYGDTVSFQMTVINQGTETAYNVELTDSIMPGFVFNPIYNAGWSNLSPNKVQYTHAGPLVAGDSTKVKITLTVDPSFTGRHLTNFAEISKADDDLNPNDAYPPDVDSNPDTNYGNDKYTEDNKVNGNGKNGEDEDDHDPATITVWPPLPPKCEPPVVYNVVKVNSICGENYGSIDIKMAGPESDYNYVWSPAVGVDNIARNLWSGTYFVTITKKNETIAGCDTVISVVIGNSTTKAIAKVVSTTAATCDQANGAATLSPNDPVYYTYNWSDGGTGAVRTGLTAGMYQVTVTRRYEECPDVFQVEIKKNNPLNATIQINRPATCDSANGKATVLVGGGSGNYSIMWEDSVFTAMRDKLISTQYYVFIKDKTSGCELLASTWIPSVQIVPNSIVINPSTLALNCQGDSTGTVGITVTPNTATYKIVDKYGYTYTNGKLEAGKYKVVSFNSPDCVYGEKEFEVTEPKLIDVEISMIPGDCSSKGIIKLDTVFGGNPIYSFNWGDLPGTNDPKDRINLKGGLYDLTVTDTKGCFAAKQIPLPNGPDTTKPTIIPLPDLKISCESVVPAPTQPTVSDNCDPNPVVTFSSTTTEGKCGNNKTILYTWTVTDASGNVAVYTQTISVIDNTKPVLSAVTPLLEASCDDIPLPESPTATDNCDNDVQITVRDVRDPKHFSFCKESYALYRIWTATDNCGNYDTIVQKIIVKDNTAPFFISVVPNDTTIVCGKTIPAPPSLLIVGDNCDANPYTYYKEEKIPGTCAGSYVVRRTWTATDACGNATPVVQNITIIDNDKPRFTSVPANITVDCGKVPAATQPKATDDCDGTNLVILFDEKQVAGANNTKITTRTWTVSDACGNTQTAQQVVTERACVPECKLLLSNVSISTCTYNDVTQKSEATLSVTVSWQTPPVGASIQITAAGQTKSINVLTTTSPATVNFTVPADGSTNNPVVIKYSDNTCSTSGTYNAPAPCNCTMTLSNVVVGPCVYNTATQKSEATLSVTATWTNVIVGKQIEITAAGQTKFIDPTATASPATVTFTVPADGSTNNNIVGKFAGSNCQGTAKYNAPAGCEPPKKFDLALIKRLANGQPTTVNPGDNVKFTITVYNQGDVAATQIQVTDYIPTGFTLNDANWNAAAGKATLKSLIAGPLAPGANTSVDITLRLDPNYAGTSIINTAEISSTKDDKGNTPVDVDSNPDNTDNDKYVTDDDTSGDGKNGGDEDDHDQALCTVLQVPKKFDLALVKALASGQASVVKPGDDVNFTITVINQGNVNATQVEVTDYIPTGMTLNDANWNLVGGKAKLKTLIPSINAGASASVNIKLKVDANFTGTSLTNKAEVSSAKDDKGATPTDVDSTPDDTDTDKFVTDNDVSGDGKNGGDEDDHDIANISVIPDPVKVFDLALTKKLAVGQASIVNAGDNVKFTIRIINQGDIAATQIQVTDYVPAGFTLNDANWNFAGGKASLKSLIAGPLAPGATTSVDITLKVDPSFTGVSITNKAEISSVKDDKGNTPVDVDSTPDDVDNDTYFLDDDIDGNGKRGGDEDDHDPATVGVIPAPPAVFDLALIKKLAAGQATVVQPGDNVKFTITVFNQGNVPATAIQVTDYVPTGMTLNDANWTAVGGKATLKSLIAGPLVPGGSTTVDITMKVDANFTGSTITNKAEISAAKDDKGNTPTDVDSTPDDTDNDKFVNDDDINGNGKTGGDEDDSDPATVGVIVVPPVVFDLALTKKLANGQSSSVQVGDNVKFTITVLNQGNVAATQVEVTDYIPTGMTLNDANWTLSAGKAKRTIAGPVLAGASTSVDITLKIDDNFTGSSLTNVAEISKAKDDKGNTPTDVDSTPDDVDNDKYVTNDDVTGNGKTGGDEDDHDKEVITVSPKPCSLTISQVTVLGGGDCNCDGSSGGATAKVVATITWTNIPAGATINVVLGSQTRTINPGTQNSPVTVEFTNVSAGNGKVTATFSNGTCSTEKTYNVPATSNDKTPPVFSGIPADLTLACGATIPGAATVTASDNCAGSVNVTFKEETIGTKCSCSYGIKRTWTAIDPCGNKAEFTQTITIIDNVGPVITTVHPLLSGKKSGDTITIDCKNPFIFEPTDVTISDNCCSENLKLDFEDFATAVSGECDKDGYLTLMFCQWKATDKCGNETTFKVIIKVVDNSAPVLSSYPADLNLSCNGGVVPPAAVVTATDDCDEDVKVIFTEEKINGKCAGSYTLIRRWKAVDHCGNIVSHTQTITVGDNTAPVIKPIHPLLVGKLSGDTVVVDCQNPFIFEPEDISVTDDCNPGNIEVVFDDYATAISGNCLKDGYMMLMFCQWTAIDKCGNEAHFKIIVKVVDRTAPVFVSKPADITVDLCKGQSVPALTKLSATDDCSEIVSVNANEVKQGSGCNYTLVRTWTAADSCGNVATHTQKISVIGVQPTISNVAVVQPQCGANGSITVNATVCGNGALKYSINGGQTYQNSNVFANLSSGTYNVVVSSADGACTVNHSTPVVLQSTNGDIVPDKTITIDQDNCEGTAEYCLPISNANILNYTITVNGVVNNSVVACGVFNEMSYFYGTVPGNGAAGPYKVDSWKVGNATLTGQFNDINGLVSLMNTLDPNGIWRHESATKTIQGGVKTVTYGKMEISQLGTAGKATLNPNAVQTAKGTALTLKVGTNKIVIVDKIFGCKDTVDVTVKGKTKPGTCPDIVSVKTAILVAKVCSAGADFCMNIPFANINNYLITDNGKVYTGAKSTCTKGSSINLAEGTHKLIFTDNATCCSDSVTVKVVCIKTDVIKGTTKIGQTGIMLNDVTELPGKLVELKVLPTRNGAQGGITTTAITSSTEVIFQGNQEGVEEFDVVATDEYGITDTTKYIITVVSRVDNNSTAQFEIYNAISPNGDGTNDVLVIKNIERYSDNTLTIFDRWGAQVLNQKDYSNDWNATWNGKELPDGTYFYIFTAGKDVRQSGYIEVKR